MLRNNLAINNLFAISVLSFNEDIKDKKEIDNKKEKSCLRL